jgi:hypothetical protein
MKKLFAVAFSFFAAPSFATVPITDCPVIRGHYVLLSDPTYSAGFTAVEGSTNGALLLHVDSKRTGLSYWLTFGQGNGYSDAWVSATNPPLAATSKSSPIVTSSVNSGLSFFTLSPSLEVRSEEPRNGSIAERYLFIPQLGPNIWYSPPHFGGSFDEPLRERIPRGLFELVECKPE